VLPKLSYPPCQWVHRIHRLSHVSPSVFMIPNWPYPWTPSTSQRRISSVCWMANWSVGLLGSGKDWPSVIEWLWTFVAQPEPRLVWLLGSTSCWLVRKERMGFCRLRSSCRFSCVSRWCEYGRSGPELSTATAHLPQWELIDDVSDWCNLRLPRSFSKQFCYLGAFPASLYITQCSLHEHVLYDSTLRQ